MRLGLTGFFLCATLSCSASNQTATPLPEPTLCKSADEYLAGLVELVDNNQLQGFKEAISQDLSADLRTRLIDLLIDIIDSFPPGTFSELKPISDSPIIEELLKPIATALTGVIQSGDIGYQGLERMALLMNECTGQPLLATLDSLLGDDEFRKQVDIVLTSSSADSILNSFSIDLSDVKGKEGFQALIYGLLHAISQPGFNSNEVTEIIDALSSVDPAIPALSKILALLLTPGAHLDAVQSVAKCMLEVDPEEEISALLFEILRSGITTEITAERPSPYPGGILGTIDHLLRPIVHLLATNHNTRASLVAVSGTLFRADVARKFIPDTVILIQAGVAADLLRLLVALATHEC
ncbi:MAG TPA: hypothetical protein EYN66_06150 [Myxococcales bacterium]|nr:hypothetical protein [Myxococcales bacterium]